MNREKTSAKYQQEYCYVSITGVCVGEIRENGETERLKIPTKGKRQQQKVQQAKLRTQRQYRFCILYLTFWARFPAIMNLT